MEGFLTSIVAALFPVLHNRTLSLYRYDSISDTFPDLWRWEHGRVVRAYSLESARDGLTGRIFADGAPSLVADTSDAKSNLREIGRCIVGMRVESNGVPWGVLYVGSAAPGGIQPADVSDLLPLARLIGHNLPALTADQTGNAELSTVRALAATVDAKDAYTRHHSNNVAFYARRLAKEMNLDPDEVHRIDLAGMLHDLGKIAIPDHVLQKPGGLTPEEREMVRAHAAIGANILAQASHLHSLVPLVRHHHEQFDGAGYPDRLRGKEIPLGAAILAVADAFDTMTTNRVYRRARTLGEAMVELARCSGTQFDPDVVKAMMQMVDRGRLAQEPWLNAVGGAQGGSGQDVMAWQSPVEVAVTARGRDPVDFLADAKAWQQPFADVPLLLEQAGRQAMRYWSADTAQVYLVDRRQATLQLAWSDGSAAGQRLLASGHSTPIVPMAGGLLGWVVLTNQPLILTDARYDPRWQYADDFDGPVSLMVVPLSTGAAPIGVVQFALRGEGHFGRTDAKVAQVYGSLLAQGIGATMARQQGEDPMTDVLTGLPNATYMHLFMEQYGRAPSVPMAVAFLDGDDVAGANQELGQDVGNVVIQHIARCLSGRLRPQDHLIRFAGDKFVLFLPGLGVAEGSARVEEMRMAVAETPLSLTDGRRVHVSFSAGVAEVFPEQGLQRAVRAAEQALLRAKRTGKNRVWTAAG